MRSMMVPCRFQARCCETIIEPSCWSQTRWWMDRPTGWQSLVSTTGGMLQKGKWIFFAVTYDSTAPKDNVHWYFGDEETPAQLDRATSYNRGMTGKDCGPLTIGNYNQTIHRHGKDRQFRGWLRGFTIYGSTTGNDGALDVESIREHQQ